MITVPRTIERVHVREGQTIVRITTVLKRGPMRGRFQASQITAQGTSGIGHRRTSLTIIGLRGLKTVLNKCPSSNARTRGRKTTSGLLKRRPPGLSSPHGLLKTGKSRREKTRTAQI